MKTRIAMNIKMCATIEEAKEFAKDYEDAELFEYEDGRCDVEFNYIEVER